MRFHRAKSMLVVVGVLMGVAASLAIRTSAQQPAAPSGLSASVGDRYQIAAGDPKTVFVYDRQTGTVYQFQASADGNWTPGQGFSISEGIHFLEKGPRPDPVSPSRQ